LTVILLGFDNGRAGRMAAHGQRRAAPGRCGGLPGVRAWAAAAVRGSGKASGRRVLRRVPLRARRARFLLCAPARPADRVRGLAPPGARRAARALEAVQKVLTGAWLGILGRSAGVVTVWVAGVVLVRDAVGVQWYQVQALLGDRESARSLLRGLVAERMTVSGTVSGPVTSVAWNSGVDEVAGRWLVTALSTGGRMHDLVKRIRAEFDGPVELIVLPVASGDSRYLDSLVTRQADAPLTG
jgi:hypothetical protein